MGRIELQKIEKDENRVIYRYVYDETLVRYFSQRPFIIEYPERIEEVPDGILAIPFVLNVLPVIWLTDSVLMIPELDKDIFESIQKVKKGYMDMYPDAIWKGQVVPQKVIDCTPEKSEGAAAFFSGGLDATTTLLRHKEEKPILLAIWGSDIRYDNAEGWTVMEQGIAGAAAEYRLTYHVIRSTFREFDRESELEKDYRSVLHDGWWHGVKHGIGLIGHAAPFVWLHRIKTLYIASTYCPEDGKVTCASYPTIDNYVSFCGCHTVHDGFELDRQKKIGYVADYHKKTGQKISLHVCWESTGGKNCCRCEKCYRTMMGFWAIGEDPLDYGFAYGEDVFAEMEQKMRLQYNYPPHIIKEWKHIQEALKNNWPIVRGKLYGAQVKWVLGFDFEHPENDPERRKYVRKQQHMSIKERISQNFPHAYMYYKKAKQRLSQ